LGGGGLGEGCGGGGEEGEGGEERCVAGGHGGLR
jgi:hypothetical protein